MRTRPSNNDIKKLHDLRKELGALNLPKEMLNSVDKTITGMEFVEATNAFYSLHKNILLNRSKSEAVRIEAVKKLKVLAKAISSSSIDSANLSIIEEDGTEANEESKKNYVIQFQSDAKKYLDIYEGFAECDGLFLKYLDIGQLAPLTLSDPERDKKFKDVYVIAKDILNSDEAKKLSKKVIEHIEQYIRQTYNSHYEVRGALADSAISIMTDYSTRYSSPRIQKVAMTVACAHAIMPSVLTDTMYLPHAFANGDFSYWRANLVGNVYGRCNKYLTYRREDDSYDVSSVSSTTALMVTQAATLFNAYFDIYKKLPFTQHMVTAVNYGSTIIGLLTFNQNEATSKSGLDAYLSYVEYAPKFIFSIYEFLSHRISRNPLEDRKTILGRLKIQFQEVLYTRHIPICQGDITDNRYYYLAKNIASPCTLALVTWIKPSPQLIQSTIVNGILAFWGWFTNSHLEQAYMAMIENIRHHQAKEESHKAEEQSHKAKEEADIADILFKKLTKAFEEQYERKYILLYRENDSHIMKEVRFFIFDYQIDRLFKKGEYDKIAGIRCSLRKKDGLFDFKQSAYLGHLYSFDDDYYNVFMPVLNLLSVEIKRLYAYIITGFSSIDKYGVSIITSRYDTLNESYRFYSSSDSFTRQDKKKMEESFLNVAKFLINQHAACIHGAMVNKLPMGKELLVSFEKNKISFIKDKLQILAPELIDVIAHAKLTWGGDLLAYARHVETLRNQSGEHWFYLAEALMTKIELVSDKSNTKNQLKRMICNGFDRALKCYEWPPQALVDMVSMWTLGSDDSRFEDYYPWTSCIFNVLYADRSDEKFILTLSSDNNFKWDSNFEYEVMITLSRIHDYIKTSNHVATTLFAPSVTAEMKKKVKRILQEVYSGELDVFSSLTKLGSVSSSDNTLTCLLDHLKEKYDEIGVAPIKPDPLVYG